MRLNNENHCTPAAPSEIEGLLKLVEELCDAVDAQAYDVGGTRSSLTILREIGPKLDAAQKELSALRSELAALSSRAALKQQGP